MKVVLLAYLFLLMGCGSECRNYIIRDIQLEPINIVNNGNKTDTFFNNHSSFCSINLIPEYIKCKWHLISVNSVESGLDGISGRIKEILIQDSTFANITNDFKGIVGYDHAYLIDLGNEKLGEKGPFYFSADIQDLQIKINSHKKNESGVAIQAPRIYSMPNNIRWPIYIKVFFDNDSLVKKIDYRNKEIKSYKVGSIR